MAPAPDTLRLPLDATPDRYRLTMAPDLAAASFHGSAAIELTVHTPIDHLVCNAAELELADAWVELDGDARLDASITLDPEAEQARFDLGQTIEPGTIILHVQFTGVLNDKLRGFYRSTFTQDGATRAIAVTQFEATDARRAFPCWDEPAFKAVFSVTLQVADDLLAISNGPELTREPTGDGQVRVTFADTMPMSTYLVAFVVGPLETTETVDVDGIPLRIVHGPGQAPLARFALDVGAFALRYFADYYGIIYPGDKMDMVAVPDFAFGAMENLGCVIYRETLLLVDPETATQAELLAVVDVIAHELAHMWFGDLVTMAWWNGIWLNEAFATFMEMKCSAACRPEWERWMHFGRERSSAFDTDALSTTRPIEFPVHSPAEAEGMFDVLTYQKGSAVVRMLEQYLGEDAFRDGIRRYLQTHQFGNTETGDLWDALEAETGEPVRAMMDSWIFQGGFPLLQADGEPGGLLTLRQRPFSYLDCDGGDARWHVPVAVRSGPGNANRALLDGDEVSVPVEGHPIMANAGGHGFYRVAYTEPLRHALLGHLGTLEPLERYTVLDDTLALSLAGDLPAVEVATLLERLVAIGETDLSIWQLGAAAVGILDRAVADDDRPTWSAWVRATIAPLWAELGTGVAAADDDRRRALRGLVLGLVATHGDPDALALAGSLLAQAMSDPHSVDSGLASGALTAVSVHADAAQFDAIVGRFHSGTTPQEQIRFLYAAASVADPELFEQYLALLASGDVRSQNLAFAYRAALRNRRHAAHAWAVIRDDWDAIIDRLPFNSTHRLVEGVNVQTDPDTADEIEAFLGDHPVPQATTLIAQHLERMRVSVAFHRRESDRLIRDLT